MFVFGDFNVHRSRIRSNLFWWTDRPGKLCHNFSVSNDLNQMVNFSDLNPRRWFSQSCTFGFISSDTSIRFTMAFPPLGSSDHLVVSVSIDFPSNWQWDTPFYCIAYDYSRADWDGLCDHLRYVLWKDIFKLSASAAASEFCEWFQVGIDVYIPHVSIRSSLTHLHGSQLLVLQL